LLILAVIGLIPAAIARHKGRNFFLWWLYGTVIWIVALPHALFFLGPAEPSGVAAAPQEKNPFAGMDGRAPRKSAEPPPAARAPAAAPTPTPAPTPAPPAPPAAAMSKVFISHASQDRKAAETICTALESRGIACWLSSRDVEAGENFQQSIVRAIKAAKLMVLVFSNNANDSTEINKEIALASQYKITVIPVRTEDVTPGEALAYELATRQYINLFNDWEHEMERLVARVNAIGPRAPASA
jgi:hypothetical protein